MNASTTQFDNFRPQSLKYLEVEFLSRVITEVTLGIRSALQAVGADYVSGWQMLYQKVVANRIKGVFVSAGGERFSQSFIEFEIKNLKSKHLSGAHFVQVARQPGRILRG